MNVCYIDQKFLKMLMTKTENRLKAKATYKI